ncbi:NFACT family protein [bacterium]|nr:NFACT family protein [bacterium]
MIYFDNLTLKAFVEENCEFFQGARIQKIQQPTRREFIFILRNSGETRRFYVNITPNLHHVCFMSKENEEKRFLTIPKQPPMFCMLLRKYIENGKIVKIEQPFYERILEVYIEAYDELSEKINLCLAIELMGKHSNIALYNTKNGIIYGCAHNVGAEKSRDREMRGNVPYIYPPKQNKRDFLNFNGQVNFETLADDFFGFSKPFAQMCKGQDIEKIKDFLELKHLSPVISNDYSKYALFSQLIEGIIQNSVNDMIDNYFSYHQNKEILDLLKQKLKTNISHRLKKAQNSLEKIERQLKKEKNADKYRKYGDLIMANIYNLKDFQSLCTLTDWETNQEISIPLDETKTLKDNANRYFKLYNKSKRSTEKLLELKEELTNEIGYCTQTLYTIDFAEDMAILNEIKQEVFPEYETKKSEISKIEERTIFNHKVFVGKNNKQNDYIISKLAKEDDLWFHTHTCAGSHVLLKLNANEQPNDELIFECAKLAKQYSQGANSSKIGVIYTKRKYLRKPPAANLGYVTYRNEQEIVID